MARIAIVIAGDADHADRAVAEWLAGRVRLRGGAEVDLLDVGAACLPAAPPCGLPTPPAVDDLAPWLDEADGFVLVLQGGPPNPVRQAVTWCAGCWRGKPAGLVWYGNAPPDEAGVHTLLAAVGARVIGPAVCFADPGRSGQADLMLHDLMRHDLMRHDLTRHDPVRDDLNRDETPWRT
ncbi:NAD(P)H-dependent oxidoreductase [Spirillospora sp. NPDC047279]|uniref:NAD(P)H-dependent oxidoreductase n=1 Tax=Spirillospora sp. NPDC047279 TaxID=3155478 RepID=UPI0034040F11